MEEKWRTRGMDWLDRVERFGRRLWRAAQTSLAHDERLEHECGARIQLPPTAWEFAEDATLILPDEV